MFLSFFVAILLIVFDQIVKFLTVTNLQVGESARGITNVFDFFTYVTMVLDGACSRVE